MQFDGRKDLKYAAGKCAERKPSGAMQTTAGALL